MPKRTLVMRSDYGRGAESIQEIVIEAGHHATEGDLAGVEAETVAVGIIGGQEMQGMYHYYRLGLNFVFMFFA